MGLGFRLPPHHQYSNTTEVPKFEEAIRIRFIYNHVAGTVALVLMYDYNYFIKKDVKQAFYQ